jgi:tRNA/rRNA methyltransferase
MRRQKEPQEARPQPDPRDRFIVILARPESAENVGLAARAMKNTGFRHLRVVGRTLVEIDRPRTAVHAEEILERASFHRDLRAATADLNVVFASTARPRQNFSALPFEEAVSKMFSFPPEARIGLLFGNERTGLTSAELAASNFRWTIPQASRQPSYNLAAAVLITLFEIFRRLEGEMGTEKVGPSPLLPLPRREQEGSIRLIVQKLEKRGFIHPTNKRHTTQMLHDLLGRLAMTERDRKLLLAMFS